MSDINSTSQKAVEATALDKPPTRVPRFIATSILKGAPHGVKRCCHTALGSEHCEYGGVSGVPYSYTDLISVMKLPQNQQQRPSPLRPIVCRSHAYAKVVMSRASLDMSSRPGLKSEQALEKAPVRKAVSFNKQVQQVLFSRDDKVGHKRGSMTARLSGVPSPAW
ncbi:uncharacterized protein Z520_08659 [Fonsecaea multimorphosa CBS 102226]|uniref:Uncharacterized protein n=1 Tax=Fonsecaea multimorphosa CBS 102226 TaxID=1442371 RepID=A0A0D2JYB4_9EURO|nr:uncharacterized protein Z520_08659 [Fonsecaea multimorphosa CBS 102226]KIX95539.1 hypothetical protein Z520_08659 [Fonsecaea multimorphosa CBS 102226]OAL21386.1 hypothetical protein AYO22_08109 [Fonsecaea multimorphosa]